MHDPGAFSRQQLMSLRILKFGGTSMGTADAISQSCRIVRRTVRDATPVVVVSALSGVTDELIGLIDLARKQQTLEIENRFTALQKRHHDVLSAFVPAENIENVWQKHFDPLLERCHLILTGTSLVGDISDRSYAVVCSLGERLSCRIMKHALESMGMRSAAVETDNIVRTNDQYLEATVDIPASRPLIRGKICPLVKRRTIPVLTGFIGGTKDSHTTLLGRGGSDFTASIAGICLKAQAVEIWTDVDGVMSADPRIVKDGVKTWRTIGLAEVSEMAHSGAKVLYPKTVTAAAMQRIPVIVKNTFHPSASGTTIIPIESSSGVRGIVTQSGQTLLHFTEPGMLSSAGFIQRVASVFTERKIPIDVCATSEITFTCSIASRDYSPELLKEFWSIAEVRITEHLAKVCVIGHEITMDPQLIATVMRSLGTIPLHTVSIGASHTNITLMVDESQAKKALLSLHRSLLAS